MVKIKRRRKPMTPEQKAAAIERLAKAREKQKGPAQHQNICPEVLTRPDDHPLCLKNVRSWIKTPKNKSLHSEVKSDEM